eukprot:1138213-Rhodomonas_salina.1
MPAVHQPVQRAVRVPYPGGPAQAAAERGLWEHACRAPEHRALDAWHHHGQGRPGRAGRDAVGADGAV